MKMTDAMEQDLGPVGEPNENVPVVKVNMAICKNCMKPIMELPGMDYAHGHNGSMYCNAPSPDAESIAAAARIMGGEPSNES
jgi:hypothetical protein